jgi:hypothetical protein
MHAAPAIIGIFGKCPSTAVNAVPRAKVINSNEFHIAEFDIIQD